MKFSNPNLLLYIGMGDAYAMAMEYLKPVETYAKLSVCLAFQGYIAHPRHGSGRGRYTDDTEMSIANARVLTDDDPPFSPLLFANAYMEEFERGGRRKGYSKKFQSLLEATPDGKRLLEALHPASDKNGAAMRAVPIGVLPNPGAVLRTAELQARITHDTPDGIFSAKAVALAAHYALYDIGAMKKLPEYLVELLPESESQYFRRALLTRWPRVRVVERANLSVAVATVHAVIDLVSNWRSLMDIMRHVLVWGGDTDSVAAIAWGIASCRNQDEKLPAFMQKDLEADHPETGAAYLKEIGRKLMAKYGG